MKNMQDLIQSKLKEFMALIDPDFKNTSFDKSVSVDQGGAITIRLGNGVAAHRIEKVLEKLKEGEIVGKDTVTDPHVINRYLFGGDAPPIGTDVQIIITNDKLIVSRDKQVSLRITPTATASEEEIIAGIDVATYSLQVEQSTRSLQGAHSRLQRAHAQAEDRASQALDSLRDVPLVKDYLTAKTQAAFPDSRVVVEYRRADGQSDSQRFLVEVFPAATDISDEEFRTFTDQTLTTVFSGQDAVLFLSSGDGKNTGPLFSVSGNPARLLGDIKRNDPDKLPQQKDGVERT